jgi:hypothetical protein
MESGFKFMESDFKFIESSFEFIESGLEFGIVSRGNSCFLCETWLRNGEDEMSAPLEPKYIEEDDIDSLPPDEKAFLLDYRLLTEPHKK